METNRKRDPTPHTNVLGWIIGQVCWLAPRFHVVGFSDWNDQGFAGGAGGAAGGAGGGGAAEAGSLGGAGGAGGVDTAAGAAVEAEAAALAAAFAVAEAWVAEAEAPETSGATAEDGGSGAGGVPEAPAGLAVPFFRLNATCWNPAMRSLPNTAMTSPLRESRSAATRIF